MFSRIKKLINHFYRKRINQRNQQRLANHSMSVISSNCNGAFILHDLGEQFRSPFVNLYLTPNDFIQYLKHLDQYMNEELVFIKSDKSYPVGILKDITIHFMHYHSEEEAKSKWQARSQRINKENLFIMMTDRDGCTYQNLQEFDRLPFKNKVVFTHKPYPEFASAFYVTGFEHEKQVGDLFEYVGLEGRKFYDQFDYVSWFNQTK